MASLDLDIVSPTEVAAVTGVSVRDVHRVIDEEILPPAFLRSDGRREVLVAGLPLISFYFWSAERLTADERLFTIATAGKRLIDIEPKAWSGTWVFKHDYLTVDFKPFLMRARRGLNQLAAARRLVVRSPEILSGTPVVRGTRVPVYDVAASVAKGLDPERIAAAYPSLSAKQIELCALYAKANPPRGRPRRSSIGAPLVQVRRTRIPRRSAREAAN
ncbi:MAG: DUF433 domain-containing protein [Phenylobacterium sp.]|uniref:DUF433 domain-containing protein n=1 Tax=Phenylobacterium sp. TaxID=1871053 RepID=UPI001A1960B8|nr:DUF433 domain-containing protein [Phenylobacterium sp.]MBJ7410389.1 DUF433 domain-containing protein [Phenylobacterium sp.]